MESKEKVTGGLRAGFTPLGIWAFSIGTSIGWGSFIVTCNTYLQKSGILGTVFGLLLGMAVILVITWNLQYMICRAPSAGGIYSFEKRVGGKDLGFLAFWFVLLTYMAILWANITSLPLFARFFLGSTFRFGFHYHVFGYEVWFGEALLSICAIILIGLLCAKSSRLPNRIMVAAALIFVLGFTVCAVIAAARHDSAFSYAPLYTEGSGAFAQIIRIAVISPWAFIGFENVSHFSEEYRFPVRKIRGILLWSVLITTLLYLFVCMLSISAYPPEYGSWLAYIRDMGNLQGIKAVPAFYAADYYLGQTGVTVLMLALFGVILTSLIGNLLALSRLLYAAGREGEAPRTLSELTEHGIPAKAIFAVVAISVFIPFLGRTAIGWIVDVTTLGATLIYGLISHAVYRCAQQEKLPVEKLTGAAGVFLMVCFVVLLLIPGLLPFDAMETESYMLFIVWSVLGLAYFRVLIRRDTKREYGQNVIVWLLLLALVLFASMMWVSRVTENAANNAVEQIFEYHESHPADDSDEAVREERVVFLQKQAEAISSTNTLYTSVSLGLFLLFISMLLNNYRDTQKLGEALTAAEQEARDAKKIAELKETISSLLNNMPALSFSKDAETGVYLACNQAFAEYAKKENPEGVVGLTDAEIFDAVTAAHFTEDDRMALSMDGPYIFYEDVPDAAGNQRQFQTTKLKYTDDNGRLCLLGMCEDVTDFVRIQRENATTKEAYEKARSTGIMYTHIAQSLAHGYQNLFYVDLDTEEFIEYRADDERGTLIELRREGDFFEFCRRQAEQLIYPDDRAALEKAMDRKNLLEALDQSNVFVMTYRRMVKDRPRYVSMRVSRMEDDERFIVIGITDIDEEMKQRRAAERVKEERTAYSRLSALTGDFLCVYIVAPETGRYREYSTASEFASFSLPKEGTDFFTDLRERCREAIVPEDLDRFLSLFTEENVKAEIERSGIFVMSCRYFLDGRPTYVQIKAAMIDEKEGRRMVLGINDVDAQFRQEEEYKQRLAQEKRKAIVDALTGIKNKHAYHEAEEKLNLQIVESCAPGFAVSVLDVNDLKKINDTAGHQAGDQCIRDACRIICDIFKRSPVFRVGGDEFAVISQGNDYQYIDQLLAKVKEYNAEAAKTGGVVIACGMARFENDSSVAAVFERADQNMYEDKSRLKAAEQ
ncbi:MAG: amino acid permease [Oscillospiraceae bacterium]|nr:amino acid permease [Oscillospiraceae bacterium]